MHRRQQLLAAHQVAHAVGVVLPERVVLAPLVHGGGIDLHDLGSDAPGDLQRRAFFVVRRPCGGAGVLDGGARRARNVQGLLVTAAFTHGHQAKEIGGLAVVDQHEHLGLDTELRVHVRLAEAGGQGGAGLDLCGAVHIVDFDGVADLQRTMVALADACPERPGPQNASIIEIC